MAWPSTAPASRGLGRYAQTLSSRHCTPLVLERGAAGHGHDVHFQCGGTESAADFLLCDGGGIVEVFLHESVVVLGDFLKHLVAPLFAFCHHIGGDFLDRVVSAHRLVMPEDSLHGDEVDQTLECFFSADGHLDGAGICTQHILHLTANLEEVRAGAVHFVHVAHAGNVILVGLTPYGLTLGLNATYGAECCHSAVEHAERTLYLNGEVNVSRSVNEVDFIFVARIFPEGSGGGGGDCDTTLLLLLHPVHGSGTVVHLADFVGKAGVEQNTLRCGGLTGIDVGHDTDIAGKFKMFV